VLDVRSAVIDAEDDPPNWELVSPSGILLEFGPGLRWQISSADCQPRRVAEDANQPLKWSSQAGLSTS